MTPDALILLLLGIFTVLVLLVCAVGCLVVFMLYAFIKSIVTGITFGSKDRIDE